MHSKQGEELETAESRVPQEPLLEQGGARPVHQNPHGWVGGLGAAANVVVLL